MHITELNGEDSELFTLVTLFKNDQTKMIKNNWLI